VSGRGLDEVNNPSRAGLEDLAEPIRLWHERRFERDNESIGEQAAGRARRIDFDVEGAWNQGDRSFGHGRITSPIVGRGRRRGARSFRFVTGATFCLREHPRHVSVDRALTFKSLTGSSA